MTILQKVQSPLASLSFLTPVLYLYRRWREMDSPETESVRMEMRF
jgi:hypothetical protein